MRLPATDEVVFVSGHAPIYCQKIIYYADPVLNKRRAIPPPALSFPAAESTPAASTDPRQAIPAPQTPGGDVVDGGGKEEDPQAIIAGFIGAQPVSAPVSAPDERPVAAQLLQDANPLQGANPQSPPSAAQQPQTPATMDEGGDDGQPF